MESHKIMLVEKVKKVIGEMIEEKCYSKIKISNYLCDKLHYDYTYLNNQFSAKTGSSITRYIIFYKIEKVKRLLLDDELTLSQISYEMNYSSVAHLSAQFKKVTGLTPTGFKKLHMKNSSAENV